MDDDVLRRFLLAALVWENESWRPGDDLDAVLRTHFEGHLVRAQVTNNGEGYTLVVDGESVGVIDHWPEGWQID